MLPFSDEELMPVAHSVLDSIRHVLQNHNGDAKIEKIKNGKVYIELMGKCSGCGSAGDTLKYTIERQMKIDIHPDIEVVNKSDAK